MQYGDQSAAIALLKGPAGDSTPAANDARVIHTHISAIVLNGERAWKLKRPVALPYVDFSTPALRLAACEQEVLLNRRTAPTIYLSAHRITRATDGKLELDGHGELVDAAVEMRRFDDGKLLSRLAAASQLQRPLLTALAEGIAEFHAHAPIHQIPGAASVEAVLQLNEQCAAMAPLLNPSAVQELRAALRTALAAHATRLDARAGAGRIRRCHGDLHLRNICLVDGRPTLFDCIEFNESLAVIDVLYDLSFLLMDLWHEGQHAEANWVMNRYMDQTDDADGLPLLPFFMALRASIRAQVLATQAEAEAGREREKLVHQGQAYLALALRLLRPERPRLLALGGLSGSGKSTVAAAIAHGIGPAPGARILATDRIRKRMAGVDVHQRLPAESYTELASQLVYQNLYAAASRAVSHGHAVIAEGVFSRPEEREAIAQCAAQVGVRFEGIWLEADAAALLERVQGRRGDPSDATTEVVRAQLSRYTEPGEWHIVAANESASMTAHSVLARMGAAQRQPPPWHEAPPAWDWRAQDEDGRWFWYAVQPQLGLAGGIWRAPRRAQQFAAQGEPEALWHQSCEQRPCQQD